MAATVNDLRHVVRTCPIVDNHAHNLLRTHQLRTSDFLTITTEASGDALQDTPHSLAHLRALRQLRRLYDLPQEADWQAILKKRDSLLLEGADALIRKCLKGTHTILIDDGLGNPDDFESYHWHDKFVASPCKRIVRIEAIAATILGALHAQGKLPVGVAIADGEACSLAWVAFITAFESAIVAALEADEVVGFKSVICYRTGLDIEVGRDIDVTERGLRSFRRHFLPMCEAKEFRVQQKGMNDALVISTCKLIAAGAAQTGEAKPLQFHTGLGDNDISILDSNPGLLQPLIKEFPSVPIVLLHSSYPYTREAGYLATVYKNVYIDIGEVFPMVSRGGQENIVRQALELIPTSKILWSTDGHLQPETYWLANVQGREALEKVLVECVEADDFTPEYAIEAAKNILFENSNELYNLDLQMPAVGTLTDRSRDAKSDNAAMEQRSVHPLPAEDAFRFYFIQWIDWMGTLRCRCIPSREFNRLAKANNLRFGISRGNLGTLQNDISTPKCVPVGQIYVRSDLSSVRPMFPSKETYSSATVMGSFEEEDSSPVGLCPRSCLQKTLGQLEKEFGIATLVGFEIEVTFCRKTGTGSDIAFEPIDTNHAWGTFTDEQYQNSFVLMTAISDALADIGIHIQQLHSEAGAGQYEFVLAPLPPLQAVDTLIQARQCIQQFAAMHDLRATYHPLPFPGIGTACHANISLSGCQDANVLEQQQMSFMASVLAHLPSLCAFTMPEEVSYGRVADDHWTGGTWVAWGTQNRETPLRRVATADGLSARWEVRCLDGMANAYLALHAIFSVGLLGFCERTEMTLKDCLRNPSQMSDAEGCELGIVDKLPTSLAQSLKALESDSILASAVGADVVDHYLVMKKAEQDMLNAMPERERHVWLLERY